MIFDRNGRAIRRGSVVLSPACRESVLLYVSRCWDSRSGYEVQFLTLEDFEDFSAMEGVSRQAGSYSSVVTCPTESALNCEVLYDLR